MAAAAGAVAWMAAERWRSRKASALGGISGAVAGLATVTQGSGFVEPFSAVVYGLVAGVLCYFMVAAVKERFGYDDSLDAFGVHGVGGFAGCLMTGVFATSAVNPIKLSTGAVRLGLIEGNSGQIVNQLIGALIGVAFAVVGSLIALKVTALLTPLRMHKSEEAAGMDLTLHGEEGYNLET
jgi:Amt family ammonium transporter